MRVESNLVGLSSDMVLLPVQPDSDTAGALSLINWYIRDSLSQAKQGVAHEVSLHNVPLLVEVLRICCQQLSSGVVGWQIYEAFCTTEATNTSFMSGVPADMLFYAHRQLILMFFDFFATLAANGKENGLEPDILSKLVCFWCFKPVANEVDTFSDAYRSWNIASLATKHMFMGYIRALASSSGVVSLLPTSLQEYLQLSDDYPPRHKEPGIINAVRISLTVTRHSDAPMALLRRCLRVRAPSTNIKSPLGQVQIKYPYLHECLTPEFYNALMRARPPTSPTTQAQFSRLGDTGPTTSSSAESHWQRFREHGFEPRGLNDPIRQEPVPER